jgi:hypothetical protein
VTFIGFNVTFFPMHLLGLAGIDERRGTPGQVIQVGAVRHEAAGLGVLPKSPHRGQPRLRDELRQPDPVLIEQPRLSRSIAC